MASNTFSKIWENIVSQIKKVVIFENTKHIQWNIYKSVLSINGRLIENFGEFVCFLTLETNL